jgi:hypothetical protein
VGARSHSHKEILVVGWNVEAISFPRSHCPLKNMVQVGIERKKICSGFHTPSFVARIHESHLARIKAECHVNLVVVFNSLPKSKEPSKVFIDDLIPPSISHPMKFSCVPALLNIQGDKELSYDFIVPILSESHDIPQVFGFTCNHHLIKGPVMLSLHVILVNPLEESYRFVLRNDH